MRGWKYLKRRRCCRRVRLKRSSMRVYPPKPKPPPPVSKLKRKLWKIFSEYIRRRSADWRGNASCVTCGVTKNWKELQAGHFVQGRHNMVLFDLKNTQVQCYVCNVVKHGNLLEYYDYMLNNYGRDVIKELRSLDKQNKQFTSLELLEKITFYQTALKELNQTYGD